MSEINHFTKMDFKDLKVIGQIDQKFIAAIDCKKFNLIIFDQHAVHERIRLEDLLKGKIPLNSADYSPYTY